MKYIRTNDGRILKVLDEDEQYFYVETHEDIGFRLWEKGQNDILKQADTIEELCDEYVVEDDYDFAVYHNLNIAKNTSGTCYGAIWCEWGLKYAAKLNDKGEFELL